MSVVPTPCDTQVLAFVLRHIFHWGSDSTLKECPFSINCKFSGAFVSRSDVAQDGSTNESMSFATSLVDAYTKKYTLLVVRD